MLQQFIRFPEFAEYTEFSFHLGKLQCYHWDYFGIEKFEILSV